MKITDPDAMLPQYPPNTDVRVLIPVGERFADLRSRLTADQVPFREVGYLLEQESVHTLNDDGQLTVITDVAVLARSAYQWSRAVRGPAAQTARDAFELIWQNYSTVAGLPTESLRIERFVSAAWAPYLPHPVVNPAQAEAIPHIVGSDEHLIVVAPTGAGKTVMGMVAALRTVLEQGKKAAWLVPQRSLTDELNDELGSWRQRGLRVERLSGEYRVDAQRIRDADLWVTTTEKFESICRTASLREALAEVGCLIVDEIHLLGDRTRGPFLEAILARVRGTGPQMRIIGLSATVANADELAVWLHARTVGVAWRPTQLTWQLPVVARTADRSLVEGAKSRLTSAIVTMVTADSGSVLVFCSSKRNVRRTALIIAANRGANVFGVDPDDPDTVHRVCAAARVGLHYKGWEYKREAEKGFRARELDVLVATSTVAAGVNLPARAVVVQDTEVGLKSIDVATVQQMFGRAGRLGAGENEGWAFLIVDDVERAVWQRKLLAGFRVDSQIQESLPEHVLAEAIQGRINSISQAERWWEQTLAYHQGSHDMTPLRQAVRFLIDGDFLAQVTRLDDVVELVPTELGLLTARLMVSPQVCYQLRTVLTGQELPTNPEEAERLLIQALAVHVPELAQAAISEALKADAVELKLAGGVVTDNGAVDIEQRQSEGSFAYSQGDLACAVLLMAANSPSQFHRGARVIAGIPYATMYPILEHAPRYLHWLSSQGFLGTVHPWVAIVAADLGKRIRWRRCQPGRGAGRLLWMCEQMATSEHAEELVPPLWHAATSRGLASPDWTETGRPRGTGLSPSDYAALLRDRVTGAVLERDLGEVRLKCSTTATLAVWSGSRYVTTPAPQGKATAATPGSGSSSDGSAVFTWRGDYQASGWLSGYAQLAIVHSAC
ncbi:DEAD/DEAH box helicase [Nocardia brasiliensis]|uniref:DEAD/DEAH box helicase n=1 Tax=Nocardia brasiliensis TaxID=37326 RepID=UPI002455116D|nr:DEAD/DEAH box helicase [Nocardia brasiliensis]